MEEQEKEIRTWGHQMFDILFWNILIIKDNIVHCSYTKLLEPELGCLSQSNV